MQSPFESHSHTHPTAITLLKGAQWCSYSSPFITCTWYLTTTLRLTEAMMHATALANIKICWQHHRGIFNSLESQNRREQPVTWRYLRRFSTSLQHQVANPLIPVHTAPLKHWWLLCLFKKKDKAFSPGLCSQNVSNNQIWKASTSHLYRSCQPHCCP